MDIRYQEYKLSEVARTLLNTLSPQKGAVVVGLQGDLGAGKTTLTQALAKALGTTETVVSPTFVIAKFYPLASEHFDQLVHIDAYRIEETRELAVLGWKALLSTPRTLIVVEWPERIAVALPGDTHMFTLSHEGDGRRIVYEKN